MLKDREFVVKLIGCLDSSQKEKVRFLASRCIKKQGIKVKTIEKQSLDQYIGYMKLPKDGDDNTMYLLFALATLDDEKDSPLDRTDIDQKIAILKKSKTMIPTQVGDYLTENGLEHINEEELKEQKSKPITPARLAWIWMLTKLDDRGEIEDILYDYIEKHPVIVENEADNAEEISAEKDAIENADATEIKAKIEADDGNSKQKIKKLQKDIQDFKIKNDNLIKENETLKRDVKKVNAELDSTKNNLEEAQLEIENNKTAIKNLNSKVIDKDREITELKEANEKLTLDIKNNPRVILFCRSDERYIRLPSYKVEILHTPVGLETENMEKCVAVWVVTSDYTYAELLTIRNSVKIQTREFYSLDQMIEELEGQV